MVLSAVSGRVYDIEKELLQNVQMASKGQCWRVQRQVQNRKKLNTYAEAFHGPSEIDAEAEKRCVCGYVSTRAEMLYVPAL